jgi:hypothetical protein
VECTDADGRDSRCALTGDMFNMLRAESIDFAVS